MAQLKDSQVVGDLRVTGEVIGDVNGDLHGVADTTDKVRYNTFTASNPWCIAMFDGNSQSPELGNEDRKVYMTEDPVLYYNTDARDGYVGWSFDGQAKLVKEPFTLTVSGGTTEGKDKYTFNGEDAKTLNIKAANGNTILTTSAYGELIIQTKNDNNKVTFAPTSTNSNYPLVLTNKDTGTSSSNTNTARFTTKIFCNTSDGSLTSSGTITAKNGFLGDLEGTATRAFPQKIGSSTRPIYWSANASPSQCSDTLDVSVTGSACSLNTADTTEDSIYSWMKATSTNLYVQCSAENDGSITTSLLNCTSQANGSPVWNGNYVSKFNTTLMEVCGFQIFSTVITGWYAKATKIFIDIEDDSTGNLIWIPLFENDNMIPNQYRQIVFNNMSNVNITLRFQNMSTSQKILRTTGHKEPLAKNGTYEITLYARQAHIYNAFYVRNSANTTTTFCFISDY